MNIDAEAPVDAETAPLNVTRTVPETERDPLEDAEIEGDVLELNDLVFVGDTVFVKFAELVANGDFDVEGEELMLRTRDDDSCGDEDVATEGVSVKDADLRVDTDPELDAETDLLSTLEEESTEDCVDE